MVKRYRRRRAGAPTEQVPRGASPDYVARLQTDLRTARRSCTEIAQIIEDVDHRCMAADGPVTPTLEEMTQAEMSRIYKLACAGRGVEAIEQAQRAEAAQILEAHRAALPAAADEVRALTVWEPYASLLLVPGPTGKRIETRPVPTKHRGRLAIHAGLHKWNGGPNFDTAMLDKLARAFGHNREGVLDHIGKLPRGVVIGEVDLVACARIENAEVLRDGLRLFLKMDGKSAVKVISGTEAAFGWFDPGRFVYITENPRRYQLPIPARGLQGVWRWSRA